MSRPAADLVASMTAAAVTAASTPNPFDSLSEHNWDVLFAIADTFVPPLSPDAVRPYISPKFGATAEEVGPSCPSALGQTFRDIVSRTVTRTPPDLIAQFLLVVKLLSIRPTAILLTGSPYLITEMDQVKREALITSWQQSPLSPKRRLYISLKSLVAASFLRPNPLMYRAIGHPEYDPRAHDAERFTNKEFYRFNILDVGPYAATAEITTDVVIIGSGASSGVTALRLVREGYKVLIIEKGRYFHQEELTFNEDSSFDKLYEGGGSLVTDDGSMLVLAGATLGGGTTVNWSASLRTPANVRKQWADKGAKFYDTPVYDEAMDYVMNQMGCSTANIKHSFSNQLIMDGAAKLGYRASDIPQNTGGHAHPCGFCSFGCRYGEKQGGVVNWLREAAQLGAQVIDQTEVIEIIHSGGKATGVNAVIKGTTPLRVRAKRVVVAAGSLHTPTVLLRSKFKHRGIGRGLKLHPVSVVFGRFEQELNPCDDAIMTAVCTEVDDLDGRGHGPKIESILHQPNLQYTFFPWSSGAGFRRDQLLYNHWSSMLVITRDRGSGQVHIAKNTPTRCRINYSVNKYDAWAIFKGCLLAANLLYIQGALEIVLSAYDLPRFYSNKPVEQRSIQDTDYQKWVEKVKDYTMAPLRNNFGSAHQMASCRMGESSSKAPVSPRGQLWECPNVHVVDTSAFPSASGVNPMVSCMATAHVLAGYLVEELAKESRL